MLLPHEALATSFHPPTFTYDFIMIVTEIANDFIKRLYKGLAKPATIIYRLLIFAMLIWFLTKYMMNTASNILGLFGQFILIYLTYEFALKSDVFFTWFYYPIVDALYDLSGYIMMTSANMTPKTSDFLYDGFVESDKVLKHLALAHFKIASSKASKINWIIFGGMEAAGTALAAFVLFIATWGLKIYFAIIFSIAIVSYHVLLAAFPFVIILAAYPQTRHIFWSTLRGFFRFAITPVFAAVALGVTLFVFENLHQEALNILATNNNLDADNQQDLTADFFLHSFISVFFSFVLLAKASDFAFIVTQGGGQPFGDFFSRVMSTAAGVTIAKIPVVGQAATAVGKGVKNAAQLGGKHGIQFAANQLSRSNTTPVVPPTTFGTYGSFKY